MRRRNLLNSSGIDIDPTTGRGMIGDYEVVDLGLPSGLLWATCNVGASSETGYGNYYQFGAGAVTYKTERQYYAGTENPLPSNYDTATQVMGDGFRMPTIGELANLIYTNTDYEFVTNFNGSGINGGKFTSKTNPNAYVFFPAAGGYFSGGLVLEGSNGFVLSSYAHPNNSMTRRLECSSDEMKIADTNRGDGLSVRGVHAAV